MNTTVISLMMMMMILGLYFCSAAKCGESVQPGKGKLAKQAKISRAKAQEAALGKVGGGTVFDCELEQMKGKLIYSIDISQNKLIKEVHIDAETGAVLSVESETVISEMQERAGDGAKDLFGKSADNKIYAHSLVNKVMIDNPDLLVLGLHAVAPGARDETMIASNLDRIGKKDDADDIAVATERKTILAPNLKESNKFEVQIPLMDASNRIIGATGLVFKYKTGDDELILHEKALKIRNELAKQIPDLAALFKSWK